MLTMACFDPHCLNEDGFGFRVVRTGILDHPIGHGGGPAVDIVPFLGTFIEQSLGENDFPLGRLAVRQVDFALENGDDGLVVVVLDLLDRPPRGVGRLGGDDTHLLERGSAEPGSP